MRISRRVIDNSIEEMAIAGMIISDSFLKHTFKATLPEYFKVDSIRIICRWCREYYQEHKKAPRQDIYEVFKLQSRDLEDDEAQIVKTHLSKILNIYESKDFNDKYVSQKVLPYLEANALERLAEEMLILVKRGDIQGAKHLKEVGVKEVFHQTTQVTDIFDPKVKELAFGERTRSLFDFGGELGKYLYPLPRGKLIAFLGPPKRGKSFWLIEWAFQAFMSGLNVIFFSLEMDESEVYLRFIQRFTGKEWIDNHRVKKKKYMIPVMDCILNQNDECERPERPKPHSYVLDEKGFPEPYEENSGHKPCIHCRGKNNLFQATSWMVEVEKETLTTKEADKVLNMLKRDSGGGSLKVHTFPIRTASIKDIEAVLDDLEILEGWIADVIVIDYAGIIKEDFRVSNEKRIRVGAIWEELSRVSKQRFAQVVTAGQGNRGAASKDVLESTDMAEDWSIIMTLDELIAINETGQLTRDKVKKDRYWNRQVIEILECRFKKVSSVSTCLVLNQMELGQICLDSERI